MPSGASRRQAIALALRGERVQGRWRRFTVNLLQHRYKRYRRMLRRLQKYALCKWLDFAAGLVMLRWRRRTSRALRRAIREDAAQPLIVRSTYITIPLSRPAG